MDIFPSRNPPHDLVSNRIPEISWLGFACICMQRMAMRFREGKFLQDEAKGVLSRRFRINGFARKEKAYSPHLSQRRIATVHVYMLLETKVTIHKDQLYR